MLQVCHVLHTLAPGGAQELLVHLAAAAPSAALEVSVLSLTPTAGQAVAQDLRRLGVRVHELPPMRREDPRALARATHALRQLAPDVVHTHGKRADVVGAYAATRLRLPQVSTLHLIEECGPGGADLLVRAARRVRSTVAARVVVVSEAQRRWYTSSLGDARAARVVTVHNGVPRAPVVTADERRRVRDELGVGDDDVLVLSLGLMRPDRGHTYLVGAAALMGEDVTVVVAGDGELRGALEDQARRTSGARVVLPGFRRDVHALLAAADVVAHPSTTDALPTALLHALACGRPVVASDVGGIPEVVSSDVGVLVPPRDSAALAAAIDQLVRQPGRRREMARAAGRRHARHFSSRTWATRLRGVYDDVLPGSQPLRRYGRACLSAPLT